MLREIRVRPVVRYTITEYVDDGRASRSVPLGEFNNVTAANRIGAALAYDARVRKRVYVTFEPARGLRIETVRAAGGGPLPATRWELREAADA